MDDTTRRATDSEPAGTPPDSSPPGPASRTGDFAAATALPRPASSNTGKLLGLLVCLAIVAAAPYLIGQIVYQVRFAQLKAGADVATDVLARINPRLSDFELGSRMVAKRLEPSVVSIIRPGGGGSQGQGSGVVVDEAGYIVTNYHVVSGARSIEVRLSDGRRTAAFVVGTDKETDLAVLKIDLPNLIAAEWGNSDELEVGDFVWAVGSPFGLDRSITFGIVSAKARRSRSGVTSSLYQEYLQTDAAVNPGNSGGPLINIEGQVIGINAAIFGPTYQGISFAIPSSVAEKQYKELREKGWIERAYLGIRPQLVSQATQQRLGLAFGEGVRVGYVEPRAPAARAGIRRGDVILQWNGVEATDPTQLSQAIAATKVGSTATVRLVRGGAENGNGPSARSEIELEVIELEVQVERHPLNTPAVKRRP